MRTAEVLQLGYGFLTIFELGILVDMSWVRLWIVNLKWRDGEEKKMRSVEAVGSGRQQL